MQSTSKRKKQFSTAINDYDYENFPLKGSEPHSDSEAWCFMFTFRALCFQWLHISFVCTYHRGYTTSHGYGGKLGAGSRANRDIWVKFKDGQDGATDDDTAGKHSLSNVFLFDLFC
jgi:hypothetical protein